MLIRIFILTVFVSSVCSSTKYVCLKQCICRNDNEATCSSLKSLNESAEEAIHKIRRLTINHAEVNHLYKPLKLFKNLEELDLSSNNISKIVKFPSLPKLKYLNLRNNKLLQIKFSMLPSNLTFIDISMNKISYISKDWIILKQLKTLNVTGNPIDCHEDSISNFQKMLSIEVNFNPEIVYCASPKNLLDKSLESVLGDVLLNDMSYQSDNENSSDDDEEYMKYSSEKQKAIETDKPDTELFEGSGFEGSGGSLEFPKECEIDCSTLKPLGSSDEENASPPPPIKQQVKMVMQDIFEGLGANKESSTEANVVATTATIAEKETKKQATTETVVHALHPEVGMSGMNKSDLHKEETVIQRGEAQYTYYLIGVILCLMVAVVMFIVIKKKARKRSNMNKRNSGNENGYGEEMKSLATFSEKSNGINTEKPIKEETEPLCNDIKKTDDADFIPNDSFADSTFAAYDEMLRKHQHVTPQPERVTITASEIPAVKRTPIFVHRELNSDGEIITRAANS